MYAVFFTVCLFGAAVWTTDASYSRQEVCGSWAEVKNSIELTIQKWSELILKCTVNEICTGISCTGKYKKGEFADSLQVTIQHCTSEKPAINLKISMPSIGLQFYNQTFYSGASIPFFKPSKNPLPFEKGFIEPNFVKINDSIGNFSIYLNTTSEKGEVKIVKIFENHSIKFTPCSQKSIQSWPLPTNSGKGISIYNESLSLLRLMDEKLCRIGSLFNCSENEICEQSNTSQPEIGACICLRGHVRDASGVCKAVPRVPTTTERAKVDDSAGGTSDKSSFNSLKIALPVVLIVLVAVLAGVAYKFRWFTTLQRRMQRTRVYEEMLIDGDEVSIPSVGSNPVV